MYVFRDLHPDNILLGSEGCVLVSYISQWVCIEANICDYAREHLYVAPGMYAIEDPLYLYIVQGHIQCKRVCYFLYILVFLFQNVSDTVV